MRSVVATRGFLRSKFSDDPENAFDWSMLDDLAVFSPHRVAADPSGRDRIGRPTATISVRVPQRATVLQLLRIAEQVAREGRAVGEVLELVFRFELPGEPPPSEWSGQISALSRRRYVLMNRLTDQIEKLPSFAAVKSLQIRSDCGVAPALKDWNGVRAVQDLVDQVQDLTLHYDHWLRGLDPKHPIVSWDPRSGKGLRDLLQAGLSPRMRGGSESSGASRLPKARTVREPPRVQQLQRRYTRLLHRVLEDRGLSVFDVDMAALEIRNDYPEAKKPLVPSMTVVIPVAEIESPEELAQVAKAIASQPGQIEVVCYFNAPQGTPVQELKEWREEAVERMVEIFKEERGRIQLRSLLKLTRPDANLPEIREEVMLPLIFEHWLRGLSPVEPLMWLDADLLHIGQRAFEEVRQVISPSVQTAKLDDQYGRSKPWTELVRAPFPEKAAAIYAKTRSLLHRFLAEGASHYKPYMNETGFVMTPLAYLATLAVDPAPPVQNEDPAQRPYPPHEEAPAIVRLMGRSFRYLPSVVVTSARSLVLKAQLGGARSLVGSEEGTAYELFTDLIRTHHVPFDTHAPSPRHQAEVLGLMVLEQIRDFARRFNEPSRNSPRLWGPIRAPDDPVRPTQVISSDALDQVAERIRQLTGHRISFVPTLDEDWEFLSEEEPLGPGLRSPPP